jgi:hypothetical protein
MFEYIVSNDRLPGFTLPVSQPSSTFFDRDVTQFTNGLAPFAC